MVVRPSARSGAARAARSRCRTDHDARIKRFRRFHRFGTPALLFAGPYTEAGGLDIALEAAYELRERTPELRFAAIPDRAGRSPLSRPVRAQGARLRAPLHHRVGGEPGRGSVLVRPRLRRLPPVPRARAVARLPQLARRSRAAVRRKRAGAAHRGRRRRRDRVPDAGRRPRRVRRRRSRSLIGDVEEAARLGAPARRRVEEELSPEVAARRFRRVWSDAIENSRRRGGSLAPRRESRSHSGTR